MAGEGCNVLVVIIWCCGVCQGISSSRLTCVWLVGLMLLLRSCLHQNYRELVKPNGDACVAVPELLQRARETRDTTSCLKRERLCGWASRKRARRRRSAIPVTISSAGAHLPWSARPYVHRNLLCRADWLSLRGLRAVNVPSCRSRNREFLNETRRCVQPREGRQRRSSGKPRQLRLLWNSLI